jgi:hypothetical protein
VERNAARSFTNFNFTNKHRRRVGGARKLCAFIMSTKGHIYYDDLTECYSDSTDRSVNLMCELSALIEINVSKEWLTLEWNSQSMPSKLKLPMADVLRVNVDVDGLIIEMSEDTPTAKTIWPSKQIEQLAI